MSFLTEDADTVNAQAREDENERVQGAYFPEITIAPREPNDLYFNDHHEVNWELVDEDYND